jgi:hypothetical protein
MLKMINFFSYYFTTLKQASKVVLLEPKKFDSSFSCPVQFPYLPIQKITRKEVHLTLEEVLQPLLPEEKETIYSLIKKTTPVQAFSDLIQKKIFNQIERIVD